MARTLATSTGTPAAPTPTPTPDLSLSGTQACSEEPGVLLAFVLPPTTPSPFAGTLDASLHAILEFGRIYPMVMPLLNVLRDDVDTRTNWIDLITKTLTPEHGNPVFNTRHLLTELLFLVTRTLLPEQIAQNRDLMVRMYTARKSQSLRTMLRYDMLQEWTRRGSHLMVIESKPASESYAFTPPENYDEVHPGRRPLRPNVWPTLVAGPPDDWPTRKMTDAMKHHVTGLDRLLLFTDEEVEKWGGLSLVTNTVRVILHWQWLRRNNEIMEDMDVMGWEDVDARADESEWVREFKEKKKEA